MEDRIVKKIKNIQQIRRQYVKDRFIKDWSFEARQFIKYCEKCYTLEKVEDLMFILWFEIDRERETEHQDFSSAVIYNVNNLKIIDMLWRYLEMYRHDNTVSFGDWR